ncbi:MAG: CoA pyrophosphatase [Sulfuritalea sp.]|nr:CoA pyrophosphatase [Sulfuritalea sp.]
MNTAAPLTVARLRRSFPCADAQAPGREPPVGSGAALPAAVLVPIVVRQSGLTVLLTQRTAHLRDHAGQISFPGGRCEAGEDSPVATALRESREEVGIEPGQVEVLGLLPDYLTGTGFCITPVVGLVLPPLNLRLDDFEVAEVFEAPLEFLLDDANYRRESLEIAGRMRTYWAVPWQEYFIWGATAGMLVSLRETLRRAG